MYLIIDKFSFLSFLKVFKPRVSAVVCDDNSTHASIIVVQLDVYSANCVVVFFITSLLICLQLSTAARKWPRRKFISRNGISSSLLYSLFFQFIFLFSTYIKVSREMMIFLKICLIIHPVHRLYFRPPPKNCI